MGAFVGDSVSALLGALLGALVGALVGDSVSALLGALVSALVGAFVGTLVGAFKGTLVGPSVGALLGALLVSFVGALLGASICPLVGTFVGPFVGELGSLLGGPSHGAPRRGARFFVHRPGGGAGGACGLFGICELACPPLLERVPSVLDVVVRPTGPKGCIFLESLTEMRMGRRYLKALVKISTNIVVDYVPHINLCQGCLD
jgi:hypothetical protein